ASAGNPGQDRRCQDQEGEGLGQTPCTPVKPVIFSRPSDGSDECGSHGSEDDGEDDVTYEALKAVECVQAIGEPADADGRDEDLDDVGNVVQYIRDEEAGPGHIDHVRRVANEDVCPPVPGRGRYQDGGQDGGRGPQGGDVVRREFVCVADLDAQVADDANEQDF